MKAELESDEATRNGRLDQLLRENARLRGDLLTVARRVSHDLRTPLGGIIITSEMLREILSENGVAPESIMVPIFDSAEDMTRLIERVSLVLKASAIPLVRDRVKMDVVVFRALQRLEGKILKVNTTVSEPALWPEVTGVFSWLEVIWWNLLSNALQYGGDRVELGWQEEKMEFRFWVCDNGHGVPKEKCEKLFQPFESLHEPGASPGLGLSIAQRLVELQGGRCGYETRLEGGSYFYFTLPADKSTDMSDSLPAKQIHDEKHTFSVK
jgi:signal transduction histidine kinase